MMAFSYMELWSFELVKLDVCGSLVVSNPVTNEDNNAETYAGWGVDYLKYDNCNADDSKPEVHYPVMRDVLNKTGQPIFYSMCEWGRDNPQAPQVGKKQLVNNQRHIR